MILRNNQKYRKTIRDLNFLWMMADTFPSPLLNPLEGPFCGNAKKLGLGATLDF
jgi:hypothetical protein